MRKHQEIRDGFHKSREDLTGEHAFGDAGQIFFAIVIYLSEVLLYLGLFILHMSLAAGVVWIFASVFLYYLSRHEERLLLDRFGKEYESYMHDVGMWIPRFRRN